MDIITYVMTVYFNVLSLEVEFTPNDTDKAHASWASSLPGGWDMIEATMEYLKRERKLLVNRLSVDKLIQNIGYAIIPDESHSAEIIGRNIISGLPDRMTVTSHELYTVIEPFIDSVVTTIVTRAELQMKLFKAHERLSDTIILDGDYRFLRQLDMVIELGFKVVLEHDVVVIVHRNRKYR